MPVKKGAKKVDKKEKESKPNKQKPTNPKPRKRPRPTQKPRGKLEHEDGGETIGVIIIVNGNIKFSRHASLTENSERDIVRRYVADNGQVVSHKRSRGFKDIAKKLIDL